jgi:beta-galactosidase
VPLSNLPGLGPIRINRRDALKGIGIMSALPLLPEVFPLGQPPAAGTSQPREQLFDLGWSFLREDAPGAQDPTFDDSKWRKLDLPHDWSIEDLDPGAEATGEGTIWVGGNAPTRLGPFDVARSAGEEATGWVVGGTGWYRKRFHLAAEPGSQAEIRFDGVYMNSEVWINGQSLGVHPYGYTSFAYDLTPYLKPDGENVLAVCVRNEGKNSRWYSGSGIYRHVWLTQSGEVRILLWGVAVTTPKVSRDLATVELSVAIENRGNSPKSGVVRVRLVDQHGDSAGTTEKQFNIPAADKAMVPLSVDVKSPKLWSPAEPNLYRSEVEIAIDGKIVDRTVTSFGIRSIQVDVEHGLRINGDSIKLKGGCVHHDNGILGSAAFDRAEERRVEILKANGFNAIRCSHNPPSPAFLDACDRLGMVVIDEAFDCWNLGKNDDDYHVYFDNWWERDIASMVLRDRNHPSIIFWSIGNEIDGRREPKGVAIAKQLRGAVKKLDTSRPVTMAVPGPYDHNITEWQANDPAFLHLDVGGYNYQWQQYETDHDRFPNRVMMGTETWEPEVYEAWRSAERLPYVLGDFIWTAIDYLGESALGHTILSQTPGWWRQQYPWFNAYCGDIDLIGDKKPQSYYRDVLWNRSQLEVVVRRPLPKGRTEELANWGWWDEIHGWTWPGCEGVPLKVRAITTGDQVRLLLDGKEIGVKAVPKSAKLVAEFEVPYAPGLLQAVAFKDGLQIGSQILKTALRPAQLILKADRTAIRANRSDLAFVTVQIADAAGEPVPDLVRKIDFEVSGVGELAATGNANPKDVASFRQPNTRTFHGRCLAILRPLGSEGLITLQAKSEGLKSASVTVQCSSR